MASSSSSSPGPTSTMSAAAPATPSHSAEYLEQWAGSYPTAVCIPFMVLCPVFVGLRFLSRRLNHSKWGGWDDLLILPAMITVILSQASDMALIQDGGIGRHAAYWELNDPDTIIVWLKIAFAVEFLYLLCICFTKLSLLSIYLRILVEKRDRIIAWVLVGITIAAWLSQSIACCLQCIPFSYQWDKTIPGGSCFNQQEFYEYLSISNLITDVVMLVLPFPTIIALKIGTQQKIALGFVFLTGSCGFVASILRFVTYFKVDLLTDVTYNSGQLILWTIIEPGMYLISACLPAMRPLLNFSLQILGVSTRNGTTSQPKTYPLKIRSRDLYGDKTPLATGDDVELTQHGAAHRNANRMSRFRRPSATGRTGEQQASVVTQISSAGRPRTATAASERQIREGNYLSDGGSIQSSDSAEDWTESSRAKDPQLGGIMVTTETTIT